MSDDDNNHTLRFRCHNCGGVFQRNEQPCPNCNESAGMQILPMVNERINIREDRTAILSRLEIHLYYLLATIGVTIGVPIVFFLLGRADLISTLISVGAGLLAIYLGYKAIRELRQIIRSG